LQHYKEKLEQYEKEEQFLLDRIAQCSKLLDSSNRSAASFFSRTGHFSISTSVRLIHGPKGICERIPVVTEHRSRFIRQISSALGFVRYSPTLGIICDNSTYSSLLDIVGHGLDR
jgi:hypothetical protein